MLWSRLLVSSVALFVSASAAGDPSLQQKLCERMLGLTLVSSQPLEFDLNQGLATRGFLGAYPEANGENSAVLAAQDVYYWGHSFAVKKSIADAEAHDANFLGLSKIAYLISDVEVADLKDDTPEAIIQERFAKVMENAEIVYWDDAERIIKKDDSIPARMVRVDKEFARRLMIPETIGYFTRDKRGPRFSQGGWVFPKIRGELNYAHIFESGSSTIKKILGDARKLIGRGWTIGFNVNFEEALNMVRDQARVEKDAEGRLVKVPENSRYREPEVYAHTLQGYRDGSGFSVEVRDPAGRLVGGILGERFGNIVKLETTYYTYEDRPDGTFKSNIDMAKIAALAALKRLKEAGLDIVDAGMVTPFTAGLKGEYVSSAQFVNDMRRLRAMPVVTIDFSRPFSAEDF